MKAEINLDFICLVSYITSGVISPQTLTSLSRNLRAVIVLPYLQKKISSLEHDLTQLPLNTTDIDLCF